MFAKDAEIDVNLVVTKLNEIVAARGKKRTDRREQIELLHELLSISEAHHLGPAVAIKIKFAIVSAIFDYNPKVSDAMKPEYWAKYVITENFWIFKNLLMHVVLQPWHRKCIEYQSAGQVYFHVLRICYEMK